MNLRAVTAYKEENDSVLILLPLFDSKTQLVSLSIPMYWQSSLKQQTMSQSMGVEDGSEAMIVAEILSLFSLVKTMCCSDIETAFSMLTRRKLNKTSSTTGNI